MVRKFLIPILLSLSFLIAGIFTLSDYGINWDAPMHMLRGQAFAHLYLTGQRSYVQLQSASLSPMIIGPDQYASRYYFLPTELIPVRQKIAPVVLPERPLVKADYRVSFYQSEAWNGDYFIANDGPGHLPLIDIVAALSNRFFYQTLGILADIESFQLIYILISALGVFIVSLFAREISGSQLAGLVAGLSLALFPIFFAESHINMKDPAQAVFFMGSIWAFWHWVKSGNSGGWGGLGLFGGFVALALGVKWNIIFLPFILLPWLILIRFKAWGKLGKLGILGGVGIILFLILIWPYAWADPIQRIWGVFEYYLQTGIGKVLIQPQGHIFLGFNLYPLKLLLTQTPEIILVLGVIGGIWVIRGLPAGRQGIRDDLKTGYLLLLWLLVPIVRLSLPGIWSYGGIRQIMEVIPAMALWAGLGAYVLTNQFKNLITKLIILIPFILLIINLIHLHPNQNAYFNIFLDKNLVDWTLTYGNVYKQGVLWLNERGQKDANLAHLDGSMFAISPLWLREDISISPYHFSGFDQKEEYIMALYNPLDPPVFAKRYPERFLNPVYKIEVDRVPLLFIYKNEAKYFKIDLNKEKELKAVKMTPQSTKEADFWKIDLGQDLQITRIIVNEVDPKCIEGITQKEAIAFIPSNKTSQPVDLTKAYVFNEKKNLGERRVEYSFAAEPARFIYIYPQNNQSCFAKDKIISVSYFTI